MQAGARKEPEPPMPAQHLQKPGIEADLEPRPEYEAPNYRGSGKLAGKVALITGGDSGIGRAVAVLYARGAPTLRSCTWRKKRMHWRHSAPLKQKESAAS